MQLKWLDFKCISGEYGNLVALESLKNIPFEIKRVYYLFGLPSGAERGFHAHKNLKQVVICVAGSCQFILDNGVERTEVILDNPSRGLYIDSKVWREMHNFSANCVLIVLASDFYDEKDYIRDYTKFLAEI